MEELKEKLESMIYDNIMEADKDKGIEEVSAWVQELEEALRAAERGME